MDKNQIRALLMCRFCLVAILNDFRIAKMIIKLKPKLWKQIVEALDNSAIIVMP